MAHIYDNGTSTKVQINFLNGDTVEPYETSVYPNGQCYGDLVHSVRGWAAPGSSLTRNAYIRSHYSLVHKKEPDALDIRTGDNLQHLNMLDPVDWVNLVKPDENQKPSLKLTVIVPM